MFPKKDIIGNVLGPSYKKESTVSPFNFVLAANDMESYFDLKIIFNNDGICQTLESKWNIQNPNFKDINSLIVENISSMTAPMRHPSIMQE